MKKSDQKWKSDQSGNLLRGSGLPVPSRLSFAPGILPCVHSTQARFGILPLARLRGRRDSTGNPSLDPSPSRHKSPGREPGDCGNKSHPACYLA